MERCLKFKISGGFLAKPFFFRLYDGKLMCQCTDLSYNMALSVHRFNKQKALVNLVKVTVKILCSL